MAGGAVLAGVGMAAPASIHPPRRGLCSDTDKGAQADPRHAWYGDRDQGSEADPLQVSGPPLIDSDSGPNSDVGAVRSIGFCGYKRRPGRD